MSKRYTFRNRARHVELKWKSLGFVLIDRCQSRIDQSAIYVQILNVIAEKLERSLQALPLLTSYQALIFRPLAIINGRGCFEPTPFSTEEPACRRLSAKCS